MQEQENSRQDAAEAQAKDVQEQTNILSEQDQTAQIAREETAQTPVGEKEPDTLAKQTDETADGETASTHEKLFTLKFHLPLDDYIEFYRVMTADSIVKNKKRMTIMGAIVVLIGLFLLGTTIAGINPMTPVSMILLLMVFFLGFRSLFYYKLFYDKALIRAVTKEYKKLNYLHAEMVVDFYPNKCVEHVNEQRVETYWHTIHSIRVSAGLYMIMLAERRCLLIPKSQAGEHRDDMEALINSICENFEKTRYDV
ncbi:YcxB family protein [Anaerotruncus colihominis]|nr:YcxB family protein [Anaerotruncus colihominis]